jgi:hypothetical protein
MGKPETPRRFDGYRDRVVLVVAMLAKQREQDLIPEAVVRTPFPREHRSGAVNKGDVVVIFSPVDATKHRHR